MSAAGAAVEAPSRRRLRRLLFVSRHYASDFEPRVGGVFQRMRMLLEAATVAADAVDVLFFADGVIVDGVGPNAAQASLRAAWGIDATVHVARRASMAWGPLVQSAAATLDYRAQDDFFRFNGRVQRDAVAASLRVDTELVVAHRLYTGSVVTAENRAVPIVMDLDDIEHRSRYRKEIAFNGRVGLRSRAELAALRRGELRALRACRTSFVCSSLDRDYLASRGVHNTTVIPNAVRFEAPAPVEPLDEILPPTLLLVGTYGYSPNWLAAELLVNTIFPIVRARRKDARLLIVGESVERLPSCSSGLPNVEFVGFVSNLTDVYRRATVVCCPVTSGGGTRIKIIEAAAAWRPVVSTSLGAEGLALRNDEEIVIRDDPAAFAAACVELFDAPAKAAAIAAAAHAKARTLFERGRVVGAIVEALTTVV